MYVYVIPDMDKYMHAWKRACLYGYMHARRYMQHSHTRIPFLFGLNIKTYRHTYVYVNICMLMYTYTVLLTCIQVYTDVDKTCRQVV